MKNLIILGAGGMGKEVFSLAKHSIGYQTEFIVKGFLDDSPKKDWDNTIYPPILGTTDGYEIQPNDVFVCSIGDVRVKRIICEKMKARGAKFMSLIHQEAKIHENVTIGDGCIVDCGAVIGSDAVIGENCLIQLYSIIGHDCRIGNYCRIDTKVVCVGGVVVEDGATVHTASIISHKVVVGEGATVAAMSFVIRKVKPGITVFGNPAKRLEY